MHRWIQAVLVMITMLAVSGWADLISHQGTFENGNEVASVQFEIGEGGAGVTIFSTSFYNGGFDSYLELWKADGEWIDGNDDWISLELEDEPWEIPENAIKTLTYGNSEYRLGIRDFYVSIDLDMGTYFATLTQAGNMGAGYNLNEGFTGGADDDFTYSFYDVDNEVSIDQQRSGDWTFHIAVPEPGVSTLLLLGVAWMIVPIIRRKRYEREN